MMPNYNNSKSPFGERYPVVYGYTNDMEIMLNDSWTTLISEADQPYTSNNCIVYDPINDLRYEIIDDVRFVNMWTGDVTIINVTLPESLGTPGPCAMTFDGHAKGIMTDSGFWYNLNRLEWEPKQAPPRHPWAIYPGQIRSFRGRPTVFGQPVCNIDGTCEYKMIYQYDPFNDQWIKLGEMTDSKLYFDYVEVPKSFCDRWFQT